MDVSNGVERSHSTAASPALRLSRASGVLSTQTSLPADALLATFDAIFQQIQAIEPQSSTSSEDACCDLETHAPPESSDEESTAKSDSDVRFESANSDTPQEEDAEVSVLLEEALAAGETEQVAVTSDETPEANGIAETDTDDAIANVELQQEDSSRQDFVSQQVQATSVNDSAVGSAEEDDAILHQSEVVAAGEENVAKELRSKTRSDKKADSNGIPSEHLRKQANGDSGELSVGVKHEEAGNEITVDAESGSDQSGWKKPGEYEMSERPRRNRESQVERGQFHEASTGDGSRSPDANSGVTGSNTKGVSIAELEAVAPQPFSQSPNPADHSPAPVVNAAQAATSAARSDSPKGSPQDSSIKSTDSGKVESTTRLDVERTSATQSKNTKRAGQTENSNGVNLDRIRLIQRVARSFQKLGPSGGQVNMMLHPAELGTVQVRLRVEGRQMEASLTAQTTAAMEVLREHLPELRQRLSEFGMEIERIQVEVGDQQTSDEHAGRFSEQDFSHQRQPSSHDGPQRQNANLRASHREANEAANNLTHEILVTHHANPSGLDLSF